MIVVQPDKTKKPKKWYSVFFDSHVPVTTFNFTNSIIGSGVIGMPYGFAQSGIVVTLILSALITFLADYTLLVLIFCSDKIGVKSYQALSRTVLGIPGYLVVTILQFGYPFLSLISYNIIIGDTITKVCVDLFNVPTTSILNNRYFIIGVATILVTLPLCSLKKISMLGKTSFLSCVLLLFVTIVMFIRLFTQKGHFPVDFSNIYSAQTNILGVANTFSILAFAFMTHHNAIFIYNDLENPTFSKWKKVTNTSVIGSILFTVLFGLIGYISFGADSQGDVTTNYCLRDPLMNVARFAYALIIAFSFPLEGVVCRLVLNILATRLGFGKYEGKLHYFFAVLVVGASVGISFINDCLGNILDLNGSTTAIPMSYIIPPLIMIVILYKHDNIRKIKPYILPVCVLVLGVFFFAIGIYANVMAFVVGFQCSPGADPSYCPALYPSEYSRFIKPAINTTLSVLTK